MNDAQIILLSKFSSEEFESKLVSKIASFSGLIDTETAIKLLLKDEGIINLKKLNQINRNDRNFSILCIVQKLWPIVEYSSGKKSRVLEVNDSVSNARILFWNSDTNISVRKNDLLLIKGLSERGGELYLSYSGELEVIKKSSFFDFSDSTDSESIHIKGKVVEVFDNILIITDGIHSKKCIVDDRVYNIKVNDDIIIEDLQIKNNIFYTTQDSRILIKPQSTIVGIVDSVSYTCLDGTEFLEFVIDGKTIKLNREFFLKLSKITISSDISLTTLNKLINYLGKKIVIKTNQNL